MHSSRRLRRLLFVKCSEDTRWSLVGEDVDGNRWRLLSALVADLLRELIPPSSVGTQHWATLRERGLVDFMGRKGS